MNVGTLGICCPLRRGGRLAAKPPDGARTWDRGNKSRCSVLMAGFSWQGPHGKSPLRRGGAVSGKAPDGARTWDRGNKSRCSVLMTWFSWPRGGCNFKQLRTYRNPQWFKRGSLFPKLTLYQGLGYKIISLRTYVPRGAQRDRVDFFPKVPEIRRI